MGGAGFVLGVADPPCQLTLNGGIVKKGKWAIAAGKSSNFSGTIWHFYEVKVVKNLSR